MPSKVAQSVLTAVYTLWLRLGIPENLRVDNELAFTEARPIHEAWDLLFVSACIMESISGSFHLPSRGGMESSRSLMIITSRSFSTKSPCPPCHSFGKNHWHSSTGITALIATARSKGKLLSRHWLTWRKNWSSRARAMPLDIPWISRRKVDSISFDSFEATAGSTSTAKCSPLHQRPSTNTLWLLSTSKNKS